MILRYDQGMDTPNETPRPMPEPPECTCMNRGNSCLTCLDAIGWDPDASCPSCPVHAGPTYSETERLTDAADHSEHEGAPTMSTPTDPHHDPRPWQDCALKDICAGDLVETQVGDRLRISVAHHQDEYGNWYTKLGYPLSYDNNWPLRRIPALNGDDA